MTDNPLDRARQALQSSQAGRAPTALPDRSNVNALLARAREAAEDRPRTRPVEPARPTAAPGPEKVRVAMTCSTTGQPFVEVAERHGDVLRMVGHHELPQPGPGGTGRPGLLSGSYRVETVEGWACPICHSPDRGLWMCQCEELRGALHCGGAAGRARHCACGKLEERHLVEMPTMQVRGAAVVATPSNAPSGLVTPRTPPALPRGSVPATPRLSWRR